MVKSRRLLFLLSFFCVFLSLTWYTLEEIKLQYQTAQKTVASYRFRAPGRALIVVDRNEKYIGQLGVDKFAYTPFEKLAQPFIETLIVTEDENFWAHPGISVSSIIRASWINLKSLSWKQGASTLTQQLVKLEFLSSDKTLARKWREWLLSLAMEERFSKAEILEFYANRVYFGRNAYGIEAAARSYFEKSAGELDWAESSFLVGIIHAPSRYDSSAKLRSAKKRQIYVLSRLHGYGIIHDIQYQQLSAKQLVLKTPKSSLGPYPYAVTAVTQQMANKSLAENHQKVVSSFDIDELNRLERIKSKLLSLRYFQKKDAQLALVSISLEDASLLGLIGGKDFSHSHFNRAWQMQRPVSAMLLPLIYGLAIKDGYSLNAGLYELRREKLENEPSIFDGMIHGSVELSTRLGLELGLVRIKEYLTNLGLQLEVRDFELILGKTAQSPMALARAYTKFLGLAESPLIWRVVNDKGESIFEAPPPVGALPVIPSSYAIRYAMKEYTAYHLKGNDSVFPSYHSFSNDGLNYWQVVFSQNKLIVLWLGSDSGEASLKEWVGSSSYYSKLYKIIVDEAFFADTINVSIPSGVSFESNQSLSLKGQGRFLPRTQRW